MLSGMSVSPGVCGECPFVFNVFLEGAGSFSWADAPHILCELLEGTGSFSSNAKNGLDSVAVGAFGYLAEDILLVPVLDMVQKGGFECFFLWMRMEGPIPLVA